MVAYAYSLEHSIGERQEDPWSSSIHWSANLDKSMNFSCTERPFLKNQSIESNRTETPDIDLWHTHRHTHEHLTKHIQIQYATYTIVLNQEFNH